MAGELASRFTYRKFRKPQRHGLGLPINLPPSCLHDGPGWRGEAQALPFMPVVDVSVRGTRQKKHVFAVWMSIYSIRN